jgi:toxin ParE1/3/4
MGQSPADYHLKQIDECFLQIARNPEIGTSCDFIRTGYRKFPQASHLIFYRQDAVGVIEIIRVLHRSIDVESKLSRA